MKERYIIEVGRVVSHQNGQTRTCSRKETAEFIEFVLRCKVTKIIPARAPEGDLERAMELYPDRIEHHEARAEETRIGKRKP